MFHNGGTQEALYGSTARLAHAGRAADAAATGSHGGRRTAAGRSCDAATCVAPAAPAAATETRRERTVFVRRTEHPHNTSQQVREYLTEALAIVGELELTDELRVPAFEKACDLLAGKQVTFEQVAPAGFDLSRLPRG